MSEEVLELLERLTVADRRAAVWCAAQCAKTALHLVPEGASQPRVAVETAEAWVRGEVTDEECSGAALEAHHAGFRAPSARETHAAYAASCAARHATTDTGSQRAYWERAPAADAASFAAAAHSSLTSTKARNKARARHIALLLDLVAAIRWPLTCPSPGQLAAAPGPVAVAWDLVALDARTEHTIPELVESHARAERLGLDWSDPMQRAIAERALDEDRIRTLLIS